MSRPFDKVRYKGLLEGLEITELKLSKLQKENPTERFDSEYVKKEFLQNVARIETFSGGWTPLGNELTNLTGGATPLGAEYPDAGIRFLRVQNIMQNYIDDSDITYITHQADQELARSKLRVNDVLLTITGVSYGKSAVVTPELVGCNINQHSVRIELKEGKLRPFFLSTFLNSRQGKLQSDQNITGVTRPALDYEAIRRFRIPLLSNHVQLAVEANVLRAHTNFLAAKTAFMDAEQKLLRHLKLDKWQPPDPLTYTRRASDAFTIGRLDADYFAPRVTELLQKLGEAGLTIGAVAPARHEQFSPGKNGEFDYIEIGNVRADGTVGAELLSQNEAPSRATSYVRAGDIITSSVRPIRRLSAIIAPEQDGFVCSSGFVVLQPRDVSAEVLLTYLRLPAVCELMDLHTSASLYPAISEADLLALPFHPIAKDAEAEIVNAVQSAHVARRQAHALLETAKRAVEIAIEQSEDETMRFLLESRES